MNTRNTMTSSYHTFKDKIYSKQGSQISHLFSRAWTLLLFPHAGAQPDIFQGRGSFVELGHFNKHFMKNTRKKTPLGKSLKLGQFFDFQKRAE